MWIPVKDPIGAAENRCQTEVDQIDTRNAERDIAVGHDPLLEQTIEQVEEGCFRWLEHTIGHRLDYSFDRIASRHRINP
jgi:hypothetical protein